MFLYYSLKNLEKNLINWSAINFNGIQFKIFKPKFDYYFRSLNKGFSVHGYFGEYPYLSNEERIEIIKFIRNIIGNKKKIISGSSSECKITFIFIEICLLLLLL